MVFKRSYFVSHQPSNRRGLFGKKKIAREVVDDALLSDRLDGDTEIWCNLCRRPFEWSFSLASPEIRQQMTDHLLEFHADRFIGHKGDSDS